MAIKLASVPTAERHEEQSLPLVFIDDMLMSLKYYVDEHEPHLRLLSPAICVGCTNKFCVTICPVGAYQEAESGDIQIAHQSCIECGSCRLICPHHNIAWKYPRGGFGVAYKFG